MEILSTSELSIFKPVVGNRGINPTYLKKLIGAIEEEDLLFLNPILVTPELEVIDGQHRLEAAKALKKTIYYVIVDVKPRVMYKLNGAKLKWSYADYVRSHAAMGDGEYIWLIAVAKTNDMPLPVAVHLVGSRHNAGSIRTGSFHVSDKEEFETWARQLMDISRYYDGWKRRSFIAALRTMFKNKKYDHVQFMTKLEEYPTSIKHCMNIQDYLRLLESIYNYRRSSRRIKLF
jgi:hypothetical protein